MQEKTLSSADILDAGCKNDFVEFSLNSWNILYLNVLKPQFDRHLNTCEETPIKSIFQLLFNQTAVMIKLNKKELRNSVLNSVIY